MKVTASINLAAGQVTAILGDTTLTYTARPRFTGEREIDYKAMLRGYMVRITDAAFFAGREWVKGDSTARIAAVRERIARLERGEW